jgi:hypothetical protein
MAAPVVHRSLDGARFELGGDLDLAGPATSVLDVAVNGRLYEFTSGVAGLAGEVAASVHHAGRPDFEEELSFAGGSLRLARSRPFDGRTGMAEDVLVAAWVGQRHCLVSQWYGVRTADVLGVLRTLRITEHDDGLTVVADQAAGAVPNGPATVIKHVPELGLLELCRLTRAHARTLPAWAGRGIPAGDLYQDTLSNGQPFYVLAGTDTWATVVPNHPDAADHLGRLRLRRVA